MEAVLQLPGHEHSDAETKPGLLCFITLRDIMEIYILRNKILLKIKNYPASQKGWFFQEGDKLKKLKGWFKGNKFST